MPHQITAAKFLAARGPALLWDDPGLGKTWSAVAGADLAGCRKILVTCPAAVKPHWAREFQNRQQIERPVTLVDGSPKTPPDGGVTIVSHATFSNQAALDVISQGEPYDLMIVDELHQYSQYASQRTRNLLAINNGAWKHTWRLWGLTGTPVVNSAADLWPTLAGPFQHDQTWWDFVNRFAEMKQDGLVPSGLKNAQELAQVLRPHVLRRTLDSVGIALPPLHEQHLAVTLPPAALADAMAWLSKWTPQRIASVLEAGGEIRDEDIARVRHALGLAKVEETAKYIWYLAQQGALPIVVFFQHTVVRTALHRVLSHWGLKTSWIDGKITPSQLTAAESYFQDGRIDVLLAQTQAAGQGLTLHRANTCVVAELPWTAVALQQAQKRIHRIGQTRVCGAHVLHAQNCWLEDILANVVSKKHKAAENLLSLLTTAN